ncbi:MAG: DUF2905 domain-containing protein [Thermotogota bacterium]
MAKIFIILGIVFILIGILWHFAPWLLNWFGKLPGDIRYEGENTTFFMPVVSMLIISVVLSFLLHLFGR